MKLSEYRKEIEALEAAPPVDAPGQEGAAAAMLGTLAHEIESALWQPGYKEEAKELAARARQLKKQAKEAK